MKTMTQTTQRPLVRKTLELPTSLVRAIEKKGKAARRSFSPQIVRELEEAYANRELAAAKLN